MQVPTLASPLCRVGFRFKSESEGERAWPAGQGGLLVRLLCFLVNPSA